LVEVVNAELNYTCRSGPVRCELSFRVSRFRPVQRTNIDVFQKLLKPVKGREPALT
jgi:hypothetical protein